MKGYVLVCAALGCAGTAPKDSLEFDKPSPEPTVVEKPQPEVEPPCLVPVTNPPTPDAGTEDVSVEREKATVPMKRIDSGVTRAPNVLLCQERWITPI